jgi:glycosyltransferase involved in cell wall biosynthesis
MMDHTAGQVVFAVPGSLDTPTGGYAYDRRIVEGLRALGWRVAVIDLGEGFPRPADATRAAACAQLAALAPGSLVVVDGLALGVLPEAAQALSRTHRLVALVHHPLALESGLSATEAAALRASERTALACARRVITTSAATARLVAAGYGVAASLMSVVEPGTDRVAAAPRAGRPGDTVELLAVGSLVPRKGYDLLVAALDRLKDLPWRLTIAGDRDRDPATAQELAADIARRGLDGRIGLLGAVGAEKLASLYAAADLFVLPSRFEGYGMVYAEAIAHGLPVVATRAGAIPDTVPPEAGVLVPPDDIDALAAVLRRLIANPAERERLAAGARRAQFPSWGEQAARFSRALESAFESAPPESAT